MKWMINCKEASHLISEELGHKLSFKRKVLLKMHLAMCSACATVQKQFKGLSETFKKITQKSFSEENQLSSETKERMKLDILKNKKK